ncbi:MAG: diguanylate cyclase domain-containing protein [Sphingobium yanoikuyae]
MAEPSSTAMPTLRQLLARAHLRLILFAVLMAGLTLTVTGVTVIRGYAARNLTLIAQTVAYTVEPALVFDDVDAARQGIATVAASESVRSVELHDRHGRLIAAWNRPDRGMAGNLSRIVDALFWPSPVRVPVHHGPVVVAEVQVFGDAGGLGRYILSGVATALACLGLTIVATQLLARRLQRDVTGPLAHIAQVAHAVRTDRQFDRRVPVAGIHEVDQFARDFNALLDELDEWHTGILNENRILERQATRDPLTGLGNRAMFERELAATMAQADEGDTSFAVIYVDVNRFKQVNDSHGHDAGDVMLIVIAARLRMALRPGDMAFRLGGDEFALILAAGATRSEADQMSAQIGAGMTQPIMLPSGVSIRSSLSIGSALYPQDSVDPRALLRHADAAMYAAKARSDGRN